MATTVTADPAELDDTIALLSDLASAAEDPSSDKDAAALLGLALDGVEDSFLQAFMVTGATGANTAGAHQGLIKVRLIIRLHAGNYVALTRGPSPKLELESMPLAVRIGLHLLFVGRAQRSALQWGVVQKALKEVSERTGRAYDSEGPKVLRLIENFIKTYSIPLSELEEPDLTKYKTFNSFFYRRLRLDARPIADPGNLTVLSSAADCRLVVYPSVDQAQQFWIKGREFTLQSLLKDKSLAKRFEGGSVAIFRLAPADYHRYCSPVSCIVGPTRVIPGAYYTVNPTAVNQDLDVFSENKRHVTLLSARGSKNNFFEVAMVSVGAMLVRSIRETKEQKQGDKAERGDELGYFAYGGSTLVYLFQKGTVEFDEDLLHNSAMQRPEEHPECLGVETMVKVSERIGRVLV